VYKESPAARWDVEPEEPSQIDEDADTDAGLVGIPLAALTLEEADSSEDEDDFVEPEPQGDMDQDDYID
jgi:hypothetical protein